MEPNRHPSEEQLEYYALGRLSESELEPLELHLLACVSCQDSLTETETYLSVLRPALAELKPADSKARSPWWSLRWVPSTPMLASALAAMLLAAVMLRSPNQLTPASITLRSERGGIVRLASQGPAGTPLDLHIQSSQLTAGSVYRLSIVDSSGTRAWAGEFEKSVAHIPEGLSAGTYWVRLYDGDQNLLQEYGLQLD